MKYKIGDKVRVKSYERLEDEYLKDDEGDIICGVDVFTSDMKAFCGKTVIIEEITRNRYYVQGIEEWCFTDEMFEETPCPFCQTFDWQTARVEIGEKFSHISLACASTRFEAEDQFNFCPVCGAVNPNKIGGGTDGNE